MSFMTELRKMYLMMYVASFTLNIFLKLMLYMNMQDNTGRKVLKHKLIFLSLLKTGTLISLRVRPYHLLLVLRVHQALEYLDRNCLLCFRLHSHKRLAAASLLYFLPKKSLLAADVSFLTQRMSRVLLPFHVPVPLSLRFPLIRRSSARMKRMIGAGIKRKVFQDIGSVPKTRCRPPRL